MASKVPKVQVRTLSPPNSRGGGSRELVRGVIGKSYLAQQLEQSPELSHLRIANLSLDDLYLPHARLEQLADANPGNDLLKGRGQAATHDLALGIDVLSRLKERTNARHDVRIPRFEKSLFDGEGDRVPEREWPVVRDPVDLVLFEGWMLGFESIASNEDLGQVYNLAKRDASGRQVKELLGGIDYDEPFIMRFRLEHLEKVNGELKAYDALWDLVDGWVELKPEKLGYVWEWRLEVSTLSLGEFRLSFC